MVHLVLTFPVLALVITVAGISFMPAVWIGSKIWTLAELQPTVMMIFLKAVTIPLGFYLYGFSLIIVIPVTAFILRAYVKPYRGPSVSFGVLPWYLQGALQFLARYSFLEFITPTKFLNFYLRGMGMKIGRNVYINSTRISDPSMIEIDDDATIGGSANLLAHYASGQLLIIEKVRIGKRALIGHGATIFGGVEVGDKSKVMPNSFVLPKTKIPPGETWGGIPAVKMTLQRSETTLISEQKE